MRVRFFLRPWTGPGLLIFLFLQPAFSGEPAPAQTRGHKTIAIITGENEYRTAETLAQFTDQELAPRGYQSAWVQASPKVGDAEFTNYNAIGAADLLLISVRRRTPPRAMMDLIRAHLAAGKPVVGIRTASHAFDAKPTDDQHASWSRFDVEILGANYQGHYGNVPPAGPETVIRIVSSTAGHPVLTGVRPSSFRVTSHLYKYRNPAPTVTVLLEGNVEGHDEIEPVAWVNTAVGRRVFYVSLGNPEDFKLAPFRRLLLNGIVWSLGEPMR
jgi:type 1 glutamine amidotransferase